MVGFLPNFFGIGETLPLLKIARSYIKKGGKVVIFSYGGRFKYLAKEVGCKIVKFKEYPWSKILTSVDREKIKEEKLFFIIYNEELITSFIEEEVKGFRQEGVKLLISSFNFSVNVSARILNIPSINLASGTVIPPYYRSGSVTFPENFENKFTKILPSFLKNQIARFVLLNNRLMVKDFNKIAKKYDVKPFKTFNEIILGDITFVCDDINFLGIQATKKFPEKNFIGPIYGGFFDKEEDKVDEDIKKHLERPGKSILLIMGTTRDKNLFRQIVETLNQTDYNIIIVYTTIDKNTLPKTKENILLKQFIKSPMLVHKMVDLSIIHGGRGTIYTAAYSGKPIIGIPMFIEHQYNIDNIVRNGAGIRVSQKFFKPQDLLNAINAIFSNYDNYLTNAQELATKLTKIKGEEKGAQRLVEIISEITKK